MRQLRAAVPDALPHPGPPPVAVAGRTDGGAVWCWRFGRRTARGLSRRPRRPSHHDARGTRARRRWHDGDRVRPAARGAGAGHVLRRCGDRDVPARHAGGGRGHGAARRPRACLRAGLLGHQPRLLGRPYARRPARPHLVPLAVRRRRRHHAAVRAGDLARCARDAAGAPPPGRRRAPGLTVVGVLRTLPRRTVRAVLRAQLPVRARVHAELEHVPARHGRERHRHRHVRRHPGAERRVDRVAAAVPGARPVPAQSFLHDRGQHRARRARLRLERARAHGGALRARRDRVDRGRDRRAAGVERAGRRPGPGPDPRPLPGRVWLVVRARGVRRAGAGDAGVAALRRGDVMERLSGARAGDRHRTPVLAPAITRLRAERIGSAVPVARHAPAAGGE